jgi:hypothetical protein
MCQQWGSGITTLDGNSRQGSFVHIFTAILCKSNAAYALLSCTHAMQSARAWRNSSAACGSE